MTLPSSRHAASWFAAQSFRGSSAHAPVAPQPTAVDTRPRVDYILPDGTRVALIHDHGESPQTTRSFALKGGKIVQAVRADLAVCS